jgi:hypothetical protein
VTVLQPTLTAEGRKERTCSACGAKESKSLPKLAPPAPETGDTVYFGRYPQALLGTSTPAGVRGVDWESQTVGLKESGYVAEFGDPPSGTTAYYRLEPIAWRVLQREGNKLYMMAESAIDAKPYHADLENVTWKTSTIRSWLNGYGKSSNTGGSGGIDYTSDNFIGKAFTPDERNAVTAVAVENPNNGAMEPPVPGGGRTHDKVFLLSFHDSINAGFGFKPNAGGSDAARTALATPFARARGATVVMSSPFRNKAWPWLRYPGRDARSAAFVTADGKSDYGGQYVNAPSFAVRPVLNLDKASVSISVSGGGVWTVATPDAPVHEHVWGPWVTVLQPTQTAEGREERTCLVCGEKGSRAIAKLPHTHSWGPWTVVLPPTYTSDGWEERACSACGEKEERVLAMLPHEHAWGEWIVVIEPTLTSEGSKERECSVCGEKEFQTVPRTNPPPHFHTWGPWVVVVPPTQTSAGMEERTCTTCGEHESRAIAKLDPVPHEHSWGSWTVISPATEEAEGIEERVCTVCGERERRTIPKLPPTDPPTGPSIDPPVDPPTGPSIDPPVDPPVDPPTGPSTETPDKPTAPTSIASAAMAVAAEAQWTGAQIKPYIALTLNGRALVQGEDFAAGYGTNTDIGIGYVSISGQGRYTGMKTAYFNIVPKMVKVKKVKPGKKRVKVTWAKAAAAQKITGYEISYKMKGKAAWKAKKAKAKAKSFTIKKLKKGKTYQIRIRAYKKIGARVYCSPWSKVKKSKKIR